MTISRRSLASDAPVRDETAKRILDLLLCVLTAPLTLLLLALCSAAVLLESPGGAIYAQWRVGRHGKPFRIYKFRTMVENADELKASLEHLNVLPAPDFKILDDPRITRVGKFLRRSSLDELPQLLNVLRGDMSLVGPRPTDFGLDRYRLWHTERLEIRPGMTGLWQIFARHQSDFDARLRYDIEYIDRMSIALDLWIMVLTVGAVIRGTGA
jgi:lipopolysaccharide/colanic/teichoic acid biosynthesis glycosyltransferase